MSAKTIVMLGTGAVGKSAITIQYVSHYFSHIYNPTIEDSFRTNLEIDGKVYRMSILDTAGQEEYSSLRDSYIRSGDGFVLVYSITSKVSFLEANALREEIYRVLDKDVSEQVPIVLVGNKCDLAHERQVATEDVAEIAKEWRVPFLECSAKEKTNIDQLYETALREILAYERTLSGDDSEKSSEDLEDEKNAKKKRSRKGKKGLKKLGCCIV